MLRIAYCDTGRELLVSGCREDYQQFRIAVCQAIASNSESAIPVQSTGPILIAKLIVRCGPPPNRVSYVQNQVLFSIATNLQEQFLSFIDFPEDADLPISPIQYHHHFDGLYDDGSHVAGNSLPVVFALDRGGRTRNRS